MTNCMAQLAPCSFDRLALPCQTLKRCFIYRYDVVPLDGQDLSAKRLPRSTRLSFSSRERTIVCIRSSQMQKSLFAPCLNSSKACKAAR